jgi:predicted AAA+ superfamily ATPase
LLHALLGIREQSHLYASPQLGASWEGFGIEQAIALAEIREDQCFTWSVQSGAEVDVVAQIDNRLIGLEFKASDAPRQTRSMTSAIESLGLEKLIIIYPGKKDYPINDTVQALSIANLGKLKKILP